MTLLTPHELCDSLRISRSTLHRLKKAGLPSIASGRLMRFDQDATLKWYAQFSHLTHAPDMLPPGNYQCPTCGFEGIIPELAVPGACRNCGSRVRPRVKGAGLAGDNY